MCGIAGFWQKQGRLSAEKACDELNKMLQPIVSRGPDDCGTWNDSQVFLGHRRLSILDLSVNGHQPMIDPNNGNIIVFNGEIYNFSDLRHELEIQKHYTFFSNSDTEIILKAYDAWGTDCVKRFNGMFAFAIWSPQKEQLFLARDRVGVKPLFVQDSDDIVIFASRPECIFNHCFGCREVDPTARSLYFENGYIPAPYSIWRNVRKLMPGHWMKINRKNTVCRSYWSLADYRPDPAMEQYSLDHIADQLESLLISSVKYRNIADVPLGAFLSGGIDSSLVCSIMQKLRSDPIRTFSVGFEDPERDESKYAADVASALGCAHHSYMMNNQKLLELLPTYFDNYDEPFSDYSGLPTMLVCREFRKNVTVALGGDGGDEFFHGYGFYRKINRIRNLFRMPQACCALLSRMLSLAGNKKLCQLANIIHDGDAVSAYLCIRNIRQDFTAYRTSQRIWNDFIHELRGMNCMEMFSRMDISTYMIDDVLQKVDVASMAYSLEVRAPLLDHRIMEFALRLPEKFKTNDREGKLILKKILSRYLDKKLFERPKSGFTPPMNSWLSSELKEELLAVVKDERTSCACDVPVAELKHIFDSFQVGQQKYTQFLWGLLAYRHWADKHKIDY